MNSKPKRKNMAGKLCLTNNTVAASRPKRNDPCPCNSGLKAKRCCLRKMYDGQAQLIRDSKLRR